MEAMNAIWAILIVLGFYAIGGPVVFMAMDWLDSRCWKPRCLRPIARTPDPTVFCHKHEAAWQKKRRP